jgi:hypothetical protein
MALRRPKNPTPAQREQWRGISRIDQPTTRTFGWFVRVGFRAQGDGTYAPKHSKFFGDASHGGPRKALLAARKWRDQQLQPKRRRTKTRRAPARRR